MIQWFYGIYSLFPPDPLCHPTFHLLCTPRSWPQQTESSRYPSSLSFSHIQPMEAINRRLEGGRREILCLFPSILHFYRHCSSFGTIFSCSASSLLVLKTASSSFFWLRNSNGEGNGTPLQRSCLENPMDGGAGYGAAVHGVAKSRTQLSDFTFIFCFHELEKEMASHSSVLAWRIPGTGLPSLGSHRVGHDWSNLAAAATAGTVTTSRCC